MKNHIDGLFDELERVAKHRLKAAGQIDVEANGEVKVYAGMNDQLFSDGRVTYHNPVWNEYRVLSATYVIVARNFDLSIVKDRSRVEFKVLLTQSNVTQEVKNALQVLVNDCQVIIQSEFTIPSYEIEEEDTPF